MHYFIQTVAQSAIVNEQILKIWKYIFLALLSIFVDFSTQQ